jgi:predicted esterase
MRLDILVVGNLSLLSIIPSSIALESAAAFSGRAESGAILQLERSGAISFAARPSRRGSRWTSALPRSDSTGRQLRHQRRSFLTWSKTSTALFSFPTEGMKDDTAVSLSSRTIRMLALHGSGGTGSSLMEKTMQPWMSHMKEELEVVTVDGHVPMEEGFSWWKLGPGERSFTADQYEGFETSQSIFMKALSTIETGTSEMTSGIPRNATAFDIIFGHSQGAIFITALLALQQMPYHPRIGYILNGVAWPNPYSLELDSLSVPQPPPRILVLSGERDFINPPTQAQRVVAALERAGCDVTVVTHPGGHAVPTQYDTPTWDAIHQWMLHPI